MATVTPDELLHLWAREQLSSEMAIGHVLQNLVQQQTTILALQTAVARLKAELGSVSDHAIDSPSPSTRRTTSRKR